MEIKDMGDYMKLLGSLEKGDQRVVTVKRGEEKIQLNITF